MADHDEQRAQEQEDVELVLGKLLSKTPAEAAKFFSLHRKRIVKECSFLGGPNKLLARAGNSLRVGGGGIVIQCEIESTPDVQYALKLVRPSNLGGTLQTAAINQDMAREEARRTATLTHTNVGRLVGRWQMTLPGTFPVATAGNPSRLDLDSPVVLLDWIPDAETFNSYVYSQTSIDHVVSAIEQVLSGLNHINDRGFIHWDMKSDNCLVSGEGVVKIMDIGNARAIMGEATTYSSDENAFTSKENVPTEWLFNVSSGEKSNRVTAQLKAGSATRDRPWLDLYMFARMVSRVFGLRIDSYGEADRLKREAFFGRLMTSNPERSKSVITLLNIILQRLLRPGEVDPARAEGVAYYGTAEDARRDVRKLLSEYGAGSVADELTGSAQHVVRLPVTGNTPYSQRVKELLRSSPIKRLEAHSQLGFTYYAYPGAVHGRLEHVIGVFSNALDYIRALYSDEDSGLFRLLANDHYVSATLFAAFVHDIGHGALTHYFEELKPLFSGFHHEDYAHAVLTGAIPSYYTGENRTSVESDRRELLALAERSWVSRLSMKTPSSDEFLQLASRILRPTKNDREQWRSGLLTPEGADSAAILICNSIIDGTIDADKLDYLRRDAWHAGLSYASGADVDRFLQALTVAMNTKNLSDPGTQAPTIAVSRKGVLPVESLLLARYQLFTSLYWHKTARAATCAAQEIVRTYLTEGPERGSDLPARLNSFSSEFRSRPDIEALNWIGEKIAARPSLTVQRKSIVEGLLQSLRTRRGLPKMVAQIGFRELADPDDAERFKRLLQYHEVLVGERGVVDNSVFDNERASDYLERRLEIHRMICTRVAEDLQLTGVSDARKLLKRSELLVDVPYVARDEVRHLYVVTKEESRPEECPFLHESVVMDFDRHSSFGGEVRAAFGLWAKPVRVFAFGDLANVIDRVAVDRSRYFIEVVHDAYRAIISPHMSQPSIPGFFSDP